MPKLKLMLIGAVIAYNAALPSIVRANGVDRALTAAPTVGYSAANNAIGLKSGASYGLRMGYELAGSTVSESIGVEAGVARSAAGTGGDSIRYGLNAVVPLLPTDRLTPLLMAGAGGVYAAGNNYLSLAYGAGLKYNISDYLTIRGEVRNLVVFKVGATGNGLEYVVGLSYTLDRQRQSAVSSLSGYAQDALPILPPETTSTVSGEPEAGAAIVVSTPPGESGHDARPVAGTRALPVTQAIENSSAEAIKLPSGRPAVSAGMPEPNKRPAPRLRQVKVEFATQQATVPGRYLRRVNQAARWLNLNPAATVEITGHADSTGKQRFNNKLSRQRADSLKRLLFKRRVNPARVRSRGVGSTHPLADNGTAAGRQKNRRAVASIKVPVTSAAKGAEK